MSEDSSFLEVAGTVTKMWSGDAVPGGQASWTEYRIRVSNTEFEVSKRLYQSVSQGDEVVLTLDPAEDFDLNSMLASGAHDLLQYHSEVVAITRGTSSTAQQLSALELQAAERAAEHPLGDDFGVDARALKQDPFTSARSGDWVEIAENPILWVEFVPGFVGYSGFNCYVPDSRIGPGSPHAWIKPVRVKSFPVFGRVKGLRWEGYRGDEALGSSVADRLTQDEAVEVGLSSSFFDQNLHVEAAPDRGCWVLGIDDDWLLDTERWDCCQAIAQCLLATPLPTAE